MSGEIIQMDELEEGQEEKPDTEVFLDIPVYQEIVAEWERAKKFKGIIESKNVKKNVKTLFSQKCPNNGLFSEKNGKNFFQLFRK